MEKKVLVRQATGRDKKFVKTLDRENMQPIIESHGEKYYGGMFDTFIPKNCFIIELNNQPVGFAFIHISKRILDVWSIQIKKEYSRKGYGKKLMSHLVTFSQDNNIKKIILEAHRENDKAITFYNHLGFSQRPVKRKNKIGFEYVIHNPI